MPKMPNASEVIERLARENERMLLLEMARAAESLDAYIKALEAKIKG